MLQATPSTLPSITDLLIRGKQAAMSGQRDLAREMLAHVVYLEPANAEGWLWLSGVVEMPEQVRYCLERALRIDPGNSRAQRGMEWLNARQKEVDDARAAAERVKPYWQTSKPKPLLNLVKGAATASGETSTRKPASWTSIGLTIPNSRVSRSNAPTLPVSGSTLERLTSTNTAAGPSTTTNHASSRAYREEVLAVDDDLSPRFVSNFAIHNLIKAIQKVTGEVGLDAMLRLASLDELKGALPAPNEDAALNYTRFSAFGEAMEEFYDRAVETMEQKVGREMFRIELGA